MYKKKGPATSVQDCRLWHDTPGLEEIKQNINKAK